MSIYTLAAAQSMYMVNVYGGLYDVKDGENVDNDFHNSDDGQDISEKITACAKSIPPRVPVLMEAAFPPRICACG